MPERMATADIAGVLVRVHHLLTQAESEARAAQQALERTRTTARSGHRATDHVPEPVEVARSRFLADRFADLAEEVHLLFPAGAVPDFDQWPLPVTGTDPLDLARRAEHLARSQPFTAYPPGTGPFVGRLTETIRAFS